MLNYYRTDNGIIRELEVYEEGAWVKATAPTEEECISIAERLRRGVVVVRGELDDEESPRIAREEVSPLILVDIPGGEEKKNRHSYTTIPLGILLREDVVITVCS